MNLIPNDLCHPIAGCPHLGQYLNGHPLRQEMRRFYCFPALQLSYLFYLTLAFLLNTVYRFLLIIIGIAVLHQFRATKITKGTTNTGCWNCNLMNSYCSLVFATAAQSPRLNKIPSQASFFALSQGIYCSERRQLLTQILNLDQNQCFP